MISKSDKSNKEQTNLKATFFDHADELRSRALKVLFVAGIAALIVYQFVDSLLAFIIAPVGKIVFTSPADAFLARINLSLIGGLLLAFPVLIYQLWLFFAQGLNDKEKTYLKKFAPFLALFFLAGSLFAFFVIVPISIKFLLSFATEDMVAMITVKSYVSFVGTLVIAFGVIFELPMVLMFLTKIGIATPEFLIQKRKYAVVGIFIISAVLTPPDLITQFLMAVPLIFLYEIGILFSKAVYRPPSI